MLLGKKCYRMAKQVGDQGILLLLLQLHFCMVQKYLTAAWLSIRRKPVGLSLPKLGLHVGLLRTAQRSRCCHKLEEMKLRRMPVHCIWLALYFLTSHLQ